MQRISKILLFITGITIIPNVFALATELLSGSKNSEGGLIGYFVLMFLFTYLIIPLIKTEQLPKFLASKWILYALFYFLFWLLAILYAFFCGL